MEASNASTTNFERISQSTRRSALVTVVFEAAPGVSLRDAR